ncbi:MAG TPA: septal ring lytic transglycosylase RlpA family protein [Spirochaetota bacterium]|nr:septal ring lytic transglycosylase RlpA family protein [Spirochaetota bacterium]
MKKVIAILVVVIGIMPAFSEKWVGNVATYNLPEGATMASGEKYRSGMISAACNGFRLGSTVQVINAKNGKSIDVVINDTVKPELSYFILLTPAAAREIDMEWDAGIAVVKGNFNDINSAVSLPIKGLVAEGEIDKENIKEFPEINWPVVADSSLSVRATEKPDIDKIKRPDNIEKDDKKLDADKEDKRYPYKEKEAFPSKKEENLIKYDYEFLPDKSVKTEKSSLSPTDEYAKSPVERSDKIFEDDKDRYDPKKEYVKSPIERVDKIFEDDKDRYDPKKEYVKTPIERLDKIFEDDRDRYDPKKEYVKTPIERVDKIFEDDKDKYDPKKEYVKSPIERVDKIFEDDKDKYDPKKEYVKSPIERLDKIFEDDRDRYDPKKEYVKSPIERVDKIFEDDKDRYDPKKEYVKSPDYRDKESVVDAFEEDPDKDTALKRPDIERDKIDISEDKEIEKGVDWKLYLKKGELYVRVLTSHNRVEAEKVFKNFGKIFGNAVPYKVGEKYIILLGPETKRTVGAILKMVRELGYRDAYIFEIK